MNCVEVEYGPVSEAEKKNVKNYNSPIFRIIDQLWCRFYGAMAINICRFCHPSLIDLAIERKNIHMY